MFLVTVIFYQNLDFLRKFLHKNEIMLQFITNIDLKKHAKFYKKSDLNNAKELLVFEIWP